MHCVISNWCSDEINNFIRLILYSSWYRDLYQSGKIVKKLFYPNLPEGCTLRLCQACTFSQISWMWWAKTRSNRGLKLSGIFLIWILQFAVFVDLTLCCAAAGCRPQPGIWLVVQCIYNFLWVCLGEMVKGPTVKSGLCIRALDYINIIMEPSLFLCSQYSKRGKLFYQHIRHFLNS